MKKLNGYRASHRNKWVLIRSGILSLQELALLDFYADIFDFDYNHESYGTFKTDFDAMRVIFQCKSENTVRNWHNKLLSLGFLKKSDTKGEYKLSCFTRYITPGFWKGEAAKYAEQEKDQSVEIILQSFGVKPQPVGEKVQSVGKIISNSASKEDSKALSSSKDDSNVSLVKKVLIKQEVRTEDEYQRMYQDDPDGLTPDDMLWVDENLKEILEVTEESEQGVVNLYFDGNWSKYQNSLII